MVQHPEKDLEKKKNLKNFLITIAPMRGCSPLCRVISIKLYADRAAAIAASITACGCPTNAIRKKMKFSLMKDIY
jgi:hypothetical protein